MKIIDKYLIKSFIPPFIVSLGIALFVLVMQVLWVYIDEIMGKGLSIFDITELIFYLSMTLVPTALPIAVLISSVMVTGNMAEHYELSSFKSAGIGLVRVLRPLVVAVSLITIFSILVSERVIPWANLKFYSRFYDIRKSKPTLALQEGVFNDEFQDYTMRIGKKGADGRSLENVMIFNNRGLNSSINESISKKGEMYTTANKQYIVMNLFDGTQYQETSQAGKQTFPFVRIKFKSWQKVFDLSEFEKKKTDEDLFKNHHKMKNSVQLMHFADSIRMESKRYLGDMKTSIFNSFSPIKAEMIAQSKALSEARADSLSKIKKDSLQHDTSHLENIKINKDKADINKKLDSLSRSTLVNTPYKTQKPSNGIASTDTQSLKKLPKYFYDVEKTMPVYEFASLVTIAQEKARTSMNTAENTINSLGMVNDGAGKFIYEMNMKYNFALICLVFLFIGAPMGAIIQKGGFGMPILIAIIFFMVYMVSNIYCKNLKESHDLTHVQAAWASFGLMIPIAAFLTYRALNDYKMLNFDPLKFFQKLKIPKFKKSLK
jgi:lipopolysaccharide export system permease protein